MLYTENMEKTDNKEYYFLKKRIFVDFFFEELGLAVSPILVGYEKYDANKAPIGPLKKKCYVIHYILNGNGICKYKGRQYALKPDMIFAIPPDEVIYYVQDKQNPMECIWIELSGSDCNRIFKALNLQNEDIFRTVKDPDFFRGLLCDMVENCALHDDKTGLSTLSYIYKLFSKLYEELNLKTEASPFAKEQTVRQIVSYIDIHFSSCDLNLKSLADRFFFSQQYLSKIFKQSVGVTPLHYIIMLRMKKAAAMLSSGSFTVNQVAESVGYSSPFYFSKEFKKWFLVPPSHYLALVRQDKTPPSFLNDDKALATTDNDER